MSTLIEKLQEVKELVVKANQSLKAIQDNWSNPPEPDKPQCLELCSDIKAKSNKVIEKAEDIERRING